MKKHILVAALLASAVTVGATHATGAVSDVEALSKTDTATTQRTDSQNKEPTELAVINQEDVETKRQALEVKMAERKAAIIEKLSGKRKEKCQAREATINTILDNRVSAAQRYFDKFAAIQEKLVTFTEEKKLNVQNQAALELVMNDSASAAQAAIQAISSSDFACESAAAAAPGALVKDQIGTAKEALKAYRTAIKDYAVAIKSSAEQAKTTDTVTEETN